MQYGKIINGEFVPFTEKYVRVNGRIYVNPKEDTLIRLGYKPLTVSEYPEEKEGFFISPVYSESETEIVQSYEYIETSVEYGLIKEEPALSTQEDI